MAGRVRFCFCLKPPRLKPDLVVDLFSEHAGVSQAGNVFRLILRKPSSKEIKVTNAKVVLLNSIALILKSRRMGFS